MEAIKSEDSTLNLRTLAAENKRIFGAVVTTSYDNDLVEAARAKRILLFVPDGTGFYECTNSTTVLP